MRKTTMHKHVSDQLVRHEPFTFPIMQTQIIGKINSLSRNKMVAKKNKPLMINRFFATGGMFLRSSINSQIVGLNPLNLRESLLVFH
jgi:hypothetical protein